MIKKLAKKLLVEKLPPNLRLFIYRNYFYHCKGAYVKPEVDLFKKLSDPAKTTLDIGANDGTYSIYLCRFSPRLYCFEPLPWLADGMKKKFSATKNVTVENCALGSKNETATIRIPVTKSRRYDTRSSLVGNLDEQMINGEKVTGIKEQMVEVKRLDDFHLQNVGFIKMDVEGFELEALKGARETILQNRPNMFIEIEQRHHKDMPITGVFKYILDMGYDGFFQSGEKFLPISRFDANRHQSMAPGSPKEAYCGNFIFLPIGMPEAKRTEILGRI
jgi:FkbM family methyltransferase